MNDAPPEARVEDGAALREPLTIADAARRAGVHPNTIRRLIRQGRVAARMVRGRYGDTWLVESADIDRAVGGHTAFGAGSTGGGQPGQANQPSQAGQTARPVQDAWPGAIDAPDALPAATDLSLDRARALERYTHGLLQPLVDLLRERDAAVESKDALIRAQAERIGRLESELELLRAAPRSLTSPQPIPSIHAQPAMPVPPQAPAPAPSANDDLPEHVTSLAGQVGRLRAELQLIATALQSSDEPDAEDDADAAEPQPVMTAPAPSSTSAAAASTRPAPASDAAEPAASLSAATAVTVEEMAGLFPTASRGRLALEPLDDGSAPSAETEKTPDPFATAEAAVAELRRALAPEAASQASGGNGASGRDIRELVRERAAAPPPAGSANVETDRAPAPKPRRWWWPW